MFYNATNNESMCFLLGDIIINLFYLNINSYTIKRTIHRKFIHTYYFSAKLQFLLFIHSCKKIKYFGELLGSTCLQNLIVISKYYGWV